MLRAAAAFCRRRTDFASCASLDCLTPLEVAAALSGPQRQHESPFRTYAGDGGIARPDPDVNPTPSARVVELVDGVENLTVKELVWFNKLMQERLGISDAELGIGMPMGMQMMAPAASAPAEAAAEEPPEPEQTEFAVLIEGYEASSKIKIIKEVRSLTPGLGLKEGKELVCSQRHCRAYCSRCRDCSRLAVRGWSLHSWHCEGKHVRAGAACCGSTHAARGCTV